VCGSPEWQVNTIAELKVCLSPPPRLVDDMGQGGMPGFEVDRTQWALIHEASRTQHVSQSRSKRSLSFYFFENAGCYAEISEGHLTLILYVSEAKDLRLSFRVVLPSACTARRLLASITAFGCRDGGETAGQPTARSDTVNTSRKT